MKDQSGSKSSLESLSPRARLAMAVIYRLGEASADDILQQVQSIPTYSAARSVLRALELKGFIKHQAKGLRYVYVPTVRRQRAVRSALEHVIQTFFDGSPGKLMQALLELEGLSEVKLDELQALIAKARKERR